MNMSGAPVICRKQWKGILASAWINVAQLDAWPASQELPSEQHVQHLWTDALFRYWLRL